MSARATYGQGLEGDPVQDPLERPGDLRVAVELAEQERAAEGEEELADEHDEQPALEAHPDLEPAAEVHDRSSSRWKTETGVPRSPSQAASSSAMTIERW